MNKIRIINEQIELLDSDDQIEVSLSNKLDIFDIIKLNIKILEDTDIEIYYEVNPDLPEDIMEGIIQSGNKIAGIKFVDMVNPNKSYLVEVHNGEWNFYDED